MVRKRTSRKPRRNTKRRYAVKRFNRRKKAYASTSKSMIKFDAPNGQYIPQKWLGKFRFKTGGVFSTAGANPIGFAGGGVNNFKIKMMDLLTPLSDLTGTIPWGTSFASQHYTGLAQLLNNAMYQNFLVYGCKVSFRCFPLEDVVVGMAPSINTGAISINSAMSLPYAKTQIFGAYETNRSKWISTYVDIPKFIGQKKSIFIDELNNPFTGTYAAPPANDIYMHVSLRTADTSNLDTAFAFEIAMTTYVHLYYDIQGSI